jgi:protein-S-isoprenylcysteine O-methyltransferase Ste14
MTALRKQAIIRFSLAALLIPVILYALAGTLHYWQGWLYWMVLLVPMLAAVLYFLKADPELLERRMKFQEREREQQTIVLMGTLAFVAGFIAIAIDLRLHGLNTVPYFFVLAADAGVLLGYSLILWVFKENSYASRTIEVMEGQKVITTGPYAIIRHPMYLGFLVMYLATPIALGSWWAVPVFSLYIPILVWRILSEEKVLLRDLEGYREYCRERRYRLLPFIW